jgi:hypothetical protein
MESWSGRENWVQMMLAVSRAQATRPFELLARATTELVLKARQRFEPRQASEKRREPLKWQGLEIALAV